MAGTTTDARGHGRWRLAIWGGAGALLLLPLVAMQLHAPGVAWSGSDFLVMGAMLAAVCGAWEIGLRLSRNRAYRAGVAVAALGAFLMTWMNLAVGIIGNEDNRLNWLFAWIVVMGLAGALIARFRPMGMACAMVAMAGGQAMVAVTTMLVGAKTASLSVCFAAVWLLAAALFARAARTERDR